MDVAPTESGRQRIIDLDVVRAVALIGVVVMNFHGYLINDGDQIGTGLVARIFNPWTGPLSTRFAATFMMIAGMGVTLMTNRSRRSGDRAARRIDRWRLIRRGSLLYGFGAVVNWIWDGTILFFYGAMFVVGSLLFSLRTRWLLAIGTLAAVSAAAIQWWAFERRTNDHDVSWLFNPGDRSPRGLLFDTFVNGTHPLLPWLTFFCAGIVVGRVLPLGGRTRLLIGAVAAALVAITYAANHLFATTELRSTLLATDPFSRSFNYTVCALGSSLAAFCIVGALAEHTSTARTTRVLAVTGQTTLSLYLGHIVVYNAAVHWYHLVRPTGLDTALVFAGTYWLVAIVAAALWHRFVGMGPLERVYRNFGG